MPERRARRPGSLARNGLALALGLGLAVALLGVLEVLLSRNATGPATRETHSVRYAADHAVLGWAPRPDVRTRVRKRRDGDLVYDVTYTFDAHGRRQVPRVPGAAPTHFVLFFGGSNTFGEGLEDDETLPYQLALERPGHRPYNYAFRGYGPQHALAHAETSDLRAQVAEPDGVAIYVFLAFHTDRAIGRSHIFRWTRRMPVVRIDGGRVVLDGLFETNRPFYTDLMQTFATSAIARRTGATWPPFVGAAHERLVCRILAQTRDRLLDRFERMGFVVVFHPSGSRHELGGCLKEWEIPVLDYRDALRGMPGSEAHIVGDGHISARGNRVLAAKLALDLPGVPVQGRAP